MGWNEEDFGIFFMSGQVSERVLSPLSTLLMCRNL